MSLINSKYILDKNGNPRRCGDLMKWAKWFESSGDKRRIGLDYVGKKTVSTIFIALDHSFGHGKPLVFETMVFPECDIVDRYSTRKQDIAGHKKWVKKLNEDNKTE